jgi:hypothetical protein
MKEISVVPTNDVRLLRMISVYFEAMFPESFNELKKIINLCLYRRSKNTPGYHSVLEAVKRSFHVIVNAEEIEELNRYLKEIKDNDGGSTRRFMNYLRHNDSETYIQVKNLINECVLKKKEKVKGYESVTKSLIKNIGQIISKKHWIHAEGELKYFLIVSAKKNSN